jgi:hypothetical protein
MKLRPKEMGLCLGLGLLILPTASHLVSTGLYLDLVKDMIVSSRAMKAMQTLTVVLKAMWMWTWI